MESRLGILRDKIIARAINAACSLAPSAADRVLIRRLGRLPKGMILSEALAGSGIESLTVRGAQGVFVGSASDALMVQKYAVDKVWSASTVATILDFFGPSRVGTYFDVGGNIGLTAVPIAAAGIQVVTFEPVPKNYEYLRQNLAANGVSDRVIAENVALMHEPGEIVFELSPNNHGDHRARLNEGLSLMRENEWETTVVTAKCLDDYLYLANEPIAIKIDTQGSEPFVIAGGSKLCERAKLLIIEFGPYSMNRMKADPNLFIECLSRFSTVDVYEGESEELSQTLSGEKLAQHLRDYNNKYRETPYGRYLNLVARR